ncbi:hypothetical protein, partial [Synechococcus sp. W55.2]|uniref:hypothetical protein n=1 Tax=Synechococcus sp. W55.2 TaxID=2964513 RepID=UPI0039C0C67B
GQELLEFSLSRQCSLLAQMKDQHNLVLDNLFAALRQEQNAPTYRLSKRLSTFASVCDILPSLTLQVQRGLRASSGSYCKNPPRADTGFPTA